MEITLALDRDNRRDLRMFAGDEITISLVVYAVDGDNTPVTVTAPLVITTPSGLVSIPVGTPFVVPDTVDRIKYRLTADVSGDTRTLCYGTILIQGAAIYSGNDYGGPLA